jgi:hypothetical protein
MPAASGRHPGKSRGVVEICRKVRHPDESQDLFALGKAEEVRSQLSLG